MIVFPLLSSLIAALCAGVMAFDAWRKPRPDKIIWTIAFTLFALAAGIEVVGDTAGWTELLARTYYATGVALVVVFLATGQMFLLFPVQMKKFGIAVTLLITALWVSLVFGAPIDQSRLAADGWDAIERGPELKVLGIVLNALGTLIIVGGSGWAVYKFWKTRTMRHRMVGCLLILVGTLVVASGGSLERLGSDQFLYIAMAIGVAIIFAGVLTARTPDGARVGRVANQGDPASAVSGAGIAPKSTGMVSAAGAVTASNAALAADAIGFVETLLERTDGEIDVLCAEWSVPREATTALARNEARRAWQLRSRLSPAGIARFDAQPVAARRQVATLYFDVLAWERPSRDEITELVAPADGVGLVRRGDQAESR